MTVTTMPIGPPFTPHVRALREPELSRLVGLLRGQRVRGAPRARVQRHPQRRGADRRLAAVQVPRHGPRRGAARRSHHHARRRENGGRAGVLHAVVRRARPGDRRRDGRRLAEETFRWTAADPSLRWFRQNASGLDVDDRRHLGGDAALALQGRRRRSCCAQWPTPTSIDLKYFRVMHGDDRRRAGRHLAHRLHRRSRLRDLDAGARGAARVGCADRAAAAPFDIRPAGMLALDVARIEAGLLLIDVDFFSSKKALIASQVYSPYEMGLDRLVDLDKGRFVGRHALARRAAPRPRPSDRRSRDRLDRSRAALRGWGCRRRVSATASRVAVPVYRRAGRSGRRPRPRGRRC